MAVIKIPVPIVIDFDADPLTSATLAFFVLWLLVALVQSGQSSRAVSNPANAPRKSVFGTLVGGTVCLMFGYGMHIGRIVLDNTDSTDESWAGIYAVDNLFRVLGLAFVYLSLFLATYNRVAIYVGPSSQLWFIKKIVDGVLLGVWALIFIVEFAWYLAGFIAYRINRTMSALDFSRRSTTSRSLDIANGSFFIFVHIAAIAGIVMLNSARKQAQDPVVGTLMKGMLPVVVFRTIWNIITTALYNTPGVIRTTNQSESINLADGILDQLSLAILIGIMIRLGFQTQFWDAPVGVVTQPGSAPQQQYVGQGMVGGQQGMTMLIGPNGLPILGPNGQPMFAPAAGQGSDVEAWKYQSMHSPTPVSTTPSFHQQNVLPYGQQQQQFTHLPQPPVGYSYQPPGSNMTGSPRTQAPSIPSATGPHAAPSS